MTRLTPVSFGICVTLVVSAALAYAGTGEPKLPPETLRGPAARLHQYPTPRLATPEQRARAQTLHRQIVVATRAWRDPHAATAAGFHTARPRRRVGNTSPLWFHAEHRRFHHDDIYLDPKRPDTIIYADFPGRPLVLIGVMFSMPRGMRGPTPGGPITRWHTHRVCARGNARGVTPRRDGSCPTGTTSRQGSEMMHVWFTRDLRSTFAIHAPVPELCVARLLPRAHCAHIGHHGD